MINIFFVIKKVGNKESDLKSMCFVTYFPVIVFSTLILSFFMEEDVKYFPDVLFSKLLRKRLCLSFVFYLN